MGTLANGIKDIFYTSQTTATHLPVCASDGTPQGRISVGDLASVLGAMQKTQLTLNADYNTLLNQGIYSADSTVGATVQHSPATGLQILEVYRPASSYCLQCVYGFSAEKSWWRIIYHADDPNPVFNNWLPVLTNIPSFYKNYANLSSLASALGISGFRLEVGVSDSTKNPRNSTSYHDHFFLLNSAGSGIELAAETFGDNIYYRMWYDNAPTNGKNWKKFTVSII